jgi:hypothetical protein
MRVFRQHGPATLRTAKGLRDASPDPPPKAGERNLHESFLNESSGCSTALRLFVGAKAYERFRRARLYGTDAESLLFSGGYPCGEATMGLVWRDVDNPRKPPGTIEWD